MRRFTIMCWLMVSLLVMGSGALKAQSNDFESDALGTEYESISWEAGDLEAVVADDPVSSGNNVLEVTVNNYNAAPVLEVTIPDGSTLADYISFNFSGYFAQGDVGYKDIIIVVSEDQPSGPFTNDSGENDVLGSWSRGMGGSTAWEDISIDITNDRDTLSGTIYLAFGISAAGTGDIGGTGVATMWYADNVALEGAPSTDGLVTEWGATERGSGVWPILNTSSTPAGAGSMGSSEGANQVGWKTIRGGFSETSLAVGETFVISGKLELVGSGLEDAYSPLRYALTYHEDLGTLENANTDSALWNASGGYGYEFTPVSGAGTLPNGGGGAGTVWTVVNGGWNSTYSNGGGPVTTVYQVPALSEMGEGTYDWAISYTLLSDSTSEVRWYLIEENEEYWFGGTATDTAMTTSFNAINFGIGENQAEGLTEFSITEATYQKGAPIDVPLPPFESHYLTQWGADAAYTGWPILRDSTDLDGDASMGAETTVPEGAWASIRGAFDYDVEAEAGNALIVSGEMEIVGASLGSGYTPLRYALTYYQEPGTLENAYTDSARWAGESSSSGYSFMPVSGAGTLANGGGGAGTNWSLNNGSWLSTYGNNGGPIGTVYQVPQLAEMVDGTYEWAISVEPVDSLTNEIRWYLIHEDGEYWYGGTIRDTATTTTFNSINFGFQGAEGFTQVNFLEVEVDKGAPIDVPLPPFESHYLTQWGADAAYTGWPILRDSTDLDGDASMGAETTVPEGAWASIRGAFDYDVEAEAGSALIVSGEMEIVGASLGSGYTPLRYALTYYQDPGTLENAYTDSARWAGASGSSGYSFMPVTGAGTLANGGGGAGTNWSLNNGSWLSTYGNNGGPIGTFYQVPQLAEMVPGTYEWAISVEPVDEITNEIRWYLIHEDDEYYYAGSITDTATTTTFNSINFGFQGTEGFTGVNFYEVEVEKGAPIELPPPAFFDHFIAIEGFGFLGGNYGGDWTLTPGEFTGNTTISGSAGEEAAAVRAGFQVPSTPGSEADQALVVEGSVTLEGGGFEEADSFKFGIFEAANAGAVDSTEGVGYEWNGSEDAHNGYLFNPSAGTVTAINGGVWHDESGEGAYNVSSLSSTGTPTAGTYDFAISTQPTSAGMEIRYTLSKEDGSYLFEAKVTDTGDSPATTTFNGINFATSNSTTTSMSLTDVEVTMSEAIAVSNEDNGQAELPNSFALQQNYPNPFNPTTNIKFDLPEASNVRLNVFNMLGQKVMTLVNEKMQAGFHRVSFNAQNLASGMYIYRIEAADFVSTKKMMLIK